MALVRCIVCASQNTSQGAGFFLPFFILISFSIFSLLLEMIKITWWQGPVWKPKETLRSLSMCGEAESRWSTGSFDLPKGPRKENSVRTIHLGLVYTTVSVYCMFTAPPMTEAVILWLNRRLLVICPKQTCVITHMKMFNENFFYDLILLSKNDLDYFKVLTG